MQQDNKYIGEKVQMIETSTPLNRLFKMAVLAGVENAVKIHINRGDDLNARDLNGFTPLMLAASKNKPEICKLLLEAGADRQLLDPSGQTAYSIAVCANSLHAAAILEIRSTSLNGSEAATFNLHDSYDFTLDAPLSFDLINWEPEEDSKPPEADLSASLISSIVQKAISVHKPIDTSAEWEDFDLYLPDKSFRLVLKDDEDSRDRLRLLLLRAIREGSVPIDHVDELSIKQGYSEDLETKALLTMVINDLGAEVDERIESFGNFGDSPIFVNPEETTVEEDILYETFAFIDNLESRQSEPLRLYQKDFQRKKLISGEEEVLLGKCMEIELEQALNALASWPKGMAHIFEAADLIRNDQKPLSWLSNGLVEDETSIQIHQSDEPEINKSGINLTEEPLYEDFEIDSVPSQDTPTSIFLDEICRFERLLLNSNEHSRDVEKIREALTALGLSRRFLVELAEVSCENDCQAAEQYSFAINAYKKANERMVDANLKLVFHLAKKFLYSGEPLDDLVQEGNIGLLKAIDRFDWRLGFKFSTYATWWIRQAISRHICDKARTIRLPVHLHESANRLYRESENFESKMGRLPNVEELASRLDISKRKVNLIKGLPPEAVPIDDLELDGQIAIESRANCTPTDPFEIVFQTELIREIDNILAPLDLKQQEIIRLRNGLGVEDAMTLEELGNLYGVTRERIRQIEAKALRKLKHPTRLEYLSLNVLGITYSRKQEIQSEPEEVDQ